MNPVQAALFQPATLDAYTYIPFIGDTKWYSVAREKYNPIYMYKTTDDGITITKIKTHLNRSLPYSRDFNPIEPNGITVYFPDTKNEGLSPYGCTREHLLFDMDPTTQISHMMTLLSIVRSDSPDPVPQLIETDEARPIWPGTPSRTALSHPLLRELLLVVALRSFLLQGHRLAPGAQDLVKHIALTGPPVVPHGVRLSYDAFASEFHRDWVWTDEGSRWDNVPRGLRLRNDVEAALVQNGWRDPARVVEDPEPPAAAARPEDEDTGFCDLVETLLNAGRLNTDDQRAEWLSKVARYGALRDVEFILAKIDRGSITPAHECEILPAAAAGGKGRAEVLALLLESGLDPNAVSQKHKRTVLHVAIRQGDVDMVKVLLEAGANMVKDDEWGLPIEAAEGLVNREDGAAKVALIEHWLEERGLPRDHVYLPVFVEETVSSDSSDKKKKRSRVDETASSDRKKKKRVDEIASSDKKKRSWTSSRTTGSGCCKTSGTRSGL